MVKKIHCKVVDNDWVRVTEGLDGESVCVTNKVDGVITNILLTPADARKLRKQIKKALEAIEGVDEEEAAPETSSPQFSVGDRVKIVGFSILGRETSTRPSGTIHEVTEVDVSDAKFPYSLDGVWFPASSVAPA